MSSEQVSGSITFDTRKFAEAVTATMAPIMQAVREDVRNLATRLGSRVLDGDETIATLANHLPAETGVEGTDWQAPGVAAYLADRLYRAGYALIELDGRRLGEDPVGSEPASPFPPELDSRLRSFFGDDQDPEATR